MDWDKDAVAEFIKLTLGTSAKENAKVYTEKLARRNRSDRVTLKEVRATKNLYYGDVSEERRQKEVAKRIAEGDTDLRERLGKEGQDILAREIDLFKINLCHAQYFRCSSQVIELRELKRELEQKFRELKVSEMVADSVPDHERIHHRFSISISGCPNACTDPESRVFGVHGVSKPIITDEVCSQCFACVDSCRSSAIIIRDDGPQIDVSRCDLCEKCVKVCPTGKLVSEEKGYRIMMGGRGGRFHQYGSEIFKMADKETLMNVVEAAIRTQKEEAVGYEDLTSIINRVGVAPIFQRLYRGNMKTTRKKTFNITGMTCQNCVANVTRALEAVPGLISAKVDLGKGQAQLEYDPAQTNPQALENAIVGAGYGTSHPTSSPPAGLATESCCD